MGGFGCKRDMLDLGHFKRMHCNTNYAAFLQQRQTKTDRRKSNTKPPSAGVQRHHFRSSSRKHLTFYDNEHDSTDSIGNDKSPKNATACQSTPVDFTNLESCVCLLEYCKTMRSQQSNSSRLATWLRFHHCHSLLRFGRDQLYSRMNTNTLNQCLQLERFQDWHEGRFELYHAVNHL